MSYRVMVGLAALALAVVARGEDVVQASVPARLQALIDPVAEIRTLAFGAGETLRMEFGWNGLPAGTMVMHTSEEEIRGRRHYRYRGLIESRPELRLIYSLRDTFDSVIDAETLEPRLYRRSMVEKGTERETMLLSDGARFEGRRRHGTHQVKVDVEREAAWDPISMAYLARSMPLEDGGTYRYRVYDGRSYFRVTFVVEGSEKVRVRAGTFDAWRIRPSTENLTYPEEDRKRKLKDPILWVSKDPAHVPLRIESGVVIGKVYGELVAYEPGKPLVKK